MALTRWCSVGSCGSGEAVGGLYAFQGSTFPAFWCAEIISLGGPGGLAGLHALRNNRSAASPTWDNQGDGQAAPRLELAWSSQQRQWTLTLDRGQDHLTGVAASCSNFGPLEFRLASKKAAPQQATLLARVFTV